MEFKDLTKKDAQVRRHVSLITIMLTLTCVTCVDQHEPGAGQADDDLAHGSEGPGDAGTEAGIPSLDSSLQIGQNFDGFKRLYGKFITSTGPSVRWDKIEKLPPDAVSKGQNIFYPDIKLFLSS